MRALGMHYSQRDVLWVGDLPQRGLPLGGGRVSLDVRSLAGDRGGFPVEGPSFPTPPLLPVRVLEGARGMQMVPDHFRCLKGCWPLRSNTNPTCGGPQGQPHTDRSRWCFSMGVGAVAEKPKKLQPRPSLSGVMGEGGEAHPGSAPQLSEADRLESIWLSPSPPTQACLPPWDVVNAIGSWLRP